MIYWFVDVFIFPKPFLSLETPTYLNKSENSRIIFKNIICEPQKRISGTLKTLEKVRAENPDDPFNEFLKLLDMGSISSKKHEIEMW